MTFDIAPSIIFSAWFPFSDLTEKRKRPVLALSGIDKNGDVRVAFITKTPADETQGFELLADDFEKGVIQKSNSINEKQLDSS